MARAETTVLVDAATVYAEGVLAGLRTAANIIGRESDADVPPKLTALVREQRCTVYHNQWMAQHGRAVPLQDMPERSVLIARIASYISLFPDDSHER